MDVLTQVALGAAAAQAVVPSEHQRRGAVAGGLAGLLPDADVFIRSASDPLLSLEYHRHFSHALLVIPLGAVLAASLAWLVLRRREPWRALFLPALVGWATHGPLDACTSYGTRLLWPFSDARVAWNVISIIDPLFTVPLVVGIVSGLRNRSRTRARVWFGVALAYMGLCVVQHERALGVMHQALAARGHSAAERVEAKPSLGNNVVFRCFYEWEGEYRVDAVRVPWWGEDTLVRGQSHPVLDTESLIERFQLDELQRRDLERFRHFSDGFLIEDRRQEGVVGDFRYAAVPDSVAPLWGIRVGGLAPGEHVGFESFRDLDELMRARFVDLLLGNVESDSAGPAQDLP